MVGIDCPGGSVKVQLAGVRDVVLRTGFVRNEQTDALVRGPESIATAKNLSIASTLFELEPSESSFFSNRCGTPTPSTRSLLPEILWPES